eukprot:8082493-Alexandrium_andersonii.AAC.1
MVAHGWVVDWRITPRPLNGPCGRRPGWKALLTGRAGLPLSLGAARHCRAAAAGWTTQRVWCVTVAAPHRCPRHCAASTEAACASPPWLPWPS